MRRAGVPRMSDDALMMSVNRGDADALGELYDRHAAGALRIAQSICQDIGRAEDAVNDAFVAIFNGRVTYLSQRGEVGPWILSVVHRRALAVSPRDANGPAATADAGGVRAALAALPDLEHEMLTLAFYGKLSHRQIAALLDLPPGTVKGCLRHGLDALSADLRGAAPRA